MVCMLYSTIPTPASLAVYLAGSPTETRPDTPASSVPSSSRAPSQPPEGRDLDWEDYNYQQDPAAGGGQQGDLENTLAALLAGIPDSLYLCLARNVLGRVPLTPCFVRGNKTPTLPHSFGNRPGAVADSRNGAGNGSRLYEVNIWMWR